ncbi:hypothetical protein D8Y20_10435 [Mariprofundus sp. EBB-1]|uniref:pilus assembly PilX N-terminal domain-containing protein n=1 Tax=Mariprofundus sp. EBB-1 TaxID=2650971 RepID=UPI000EF286AA|nr:pilus assembly PilX N-terminal domain-containing protein [Mariprofundus sp. EBB-1]RLL51015.1 hypothetical protein D8Y20_10435 [Mariprofundus sp. EBB-1]
MAEELMMRVTINKEPSQYGESGFVLVTSLIMLSLLTLMSVGMYFASKSGIQTSASAQTSTEAYYYAESAINYMAWAIANDAEFDNHTYAGTYVAAPFGEPLVPTNASAIGDYLELRNYTWDPGPTGVAGSSAVDTDATVYTAGQVMYFDNSPMGSRYLCMESYLNFPNCLDVTLSEGDANRVQPSMYRISAKLPRYIKLDIATDGVITASIPPLPHAAVPVVGNDIPLNGAIVWITAVDAVNPAIDVEIYPLDPGNFYGGTAATACVGGTLPDCPCTAPAPSDANYATYMGAWACDANSRTWITNYGIVAYAIGYVNGRASHLIRSIIQ